MATSLQAFLRGCYGTYILARCRVCLPFLWSVILQWFVSCLRWHTRRLYLLAMRWKFGRRTQWNLCKPFITLLKFNHVRGSTPRTSTNQRSTTYEIRSNSRTRYGRYGRWDFMAQDMAVTILPSPKLGQQATLQWHQPANDNDIKLDARLLKTILSNLQASRWAWWQC